MYRRYIQAAGVAFYLGLCFFGCASTHRLKSGASSVLVSRIPPAKECMVIGNVSGEHSTAYTYSQASSSQAMIDLKNKTFEMGGNFVFLESTNENEQISSVHGTAFKCPPDKKLDLH